MKAAVYAGTKNLYPDMVTSAKSLVAHSSVDVVYFLVESDRFPYYLPSFVKTINVSGQQYFPSTNRNAHKKWTYMTLMRCTLTKYFPSLDKILWLDADTVVQDSIDKLWELDMGDCYFAGAKEAEKSKPEAPYINAGVMMINLKKLREDGMDDVLIKELNDKEYEFPDQDCINKLCQNRILVIPATYNANKYTEMCDKPKIRHFAAETNWRNEPILYPYRNKNWEEVRKNNMRYLIHSSPSRQWYVDGYLIPSMLEQGIARDDIVVWCDTDKKGNLQSCMEAFKWCGENPMNGTWHIQDDVILSRKFAQTTKEYNFGVVAGFVVDEWGPDWTKTGNQTTAQLWYSFQCIRIPDSLAGECAKWFFTDAKYRSDYKFASRVQAKKHDDDFFLYFLQEKHPKMEIINLKPNIVDHIDYLIGGTLINPARKKTVYRAAYWEDDDLVENLAMDLRKRGMI